MKTGRRSSTRKGKMRSIWKEKEGSGQINPRIFDKVSSERIILY